MNIRKIFQRDSQPKDDFYLRTSFTGIILEGVSKVDFPGNSSLERFLQWYGNDLITPATFYLIARFIEIKPRTALLALGIGTSFFETSQGLAQSPGYDPYDFLCYGVSLSLGYLTDKKIQQQNEHP